MTTTAAAAAKIVRLWVMRPAMQPPFAANGNAQAQAQALLMSPLPVLTTLVRQNIERNMQAAANGASAMLELATNTDLAADMEVDTIMDTDMADAADPDGLPPIGSTAMVTATAAAFALLHMRRAAAPAPQY